MHKRFREEGNYYVNIFPKAVENMPWVELFHKENFNLIFVDCKPLTFDCVKTFMKLFKQNSINLIYVHFGGWDIPAKLASPCTPTIWHQRMSVNLDTPKRRFYHRVMYKVLGRFRTHHIAISDAVYGAITSLTSNKTYLIPDGIDFERLGIKGTVFTGSAHQGPVKILLFAFSAIGKGLDIAIAACQQLNECGKQVILQVVTQRNSNEYLQNHFAELPPWLEVLPPISNVFEYYNQADIFLSASRSEGFCNALLEAIYCGMPVIFSDIPGTRWAGDFSYSTMYRVEDASDLATAIDSCINIPQEASIVESNRQLAVQKYSIDKWGNDVYNAIVQSSNM